MLMMPCTGWTAPTLVAETSRYRRYHHTCTVLGSLFTCNNFVGVEINNRIINIWFACCNLKQSVACPVSSCISSEKHSLLHTQQCFSRLTSSIVFKRELDGPWQACASAASSQTKSVAYMATHWVMLHTEWLPPHYRHQEWIFWAACDAV